MNFHFPKLRFVPQKWPHHTSWYKKDNRCAPSTHRARVLHTFIHMLQCLLMIKRFPPVEGRHWDLTAMELQWFYTPPTLSSWQRSPAGVGEQGALAPIRRVAVVLLVVAAALLGAVFGRGQRVRRRVGEGVRRVRLIRGERKPAVLHRSGGDQESHGGSFKIHYRGELVRSHVQKLLLF